MAKGAYIGVLTSTALGDQPVGAVVKLKVSGTAKDFIVVNQGKPSALYDDSCNGTWLLMKDGDGTRSWNSSNTNDYQNSSIHNYLSGTFVNYFDADIRNVIKQAKIPYVNGTGKSAVASGSSGLSTKAFLLSCYEVGFTQSENGAFPIDGACLSYFSGTDAAKKRNFNHVWSLRSPYMGYTEYVFTVAADGNSSSTGATSSYYIHPAIILPSNLSVDGSGNVTTAEGGLKEVARKIKKGYVGIDGKARKIKKAYIGIGGVARPCWSGGELAYYGRITDLSVGRRNMGATTVGDYAVFAGGGNKSGNCADVDAYNKSLVRTIATKMSSVRDQLSAATAGNYAVFAGGYESGYSNRVDAYSNSLTLAPPMVLNNGRNGIGATSVGNYALFAGGIGASSVRFSYCESFNSSLSQGRFNLLSSGANAVCAATVGNYALFAGGYTGSVHLLTVAACNSSLSVTNATDLPEAHTGGLGTTIGNYALIASGNDGSGQMGVKTVAYNSTLTRIIPTDLSFARSDGAIATVGNYAVIAGGSTSRFNVEIYDVSLTKTIASNLTVGRTQLNGATIGNYALFAGGYNRDGKIYEATVEAYVAES